MIKRLCGSQNGFSIIQGMLLASVVAGMAFIGTRLTTDQKLAQKGLESKTKVEQLHSMIYSIMQNKEHCTKTFIDNAVVPAPNTSAATPRIFTAGSTQPVFVYRSWYHATRDTIYMNNSVTINSMSVNFKSDFTQHADMRIEYGKLEDDNMRVRSGKGYGGKQVAKTIKLKIQTNPLDNSFESCYAVDEAENANMVKDFCEGLGADNNTTTPNLFMWSDTYQRCLLQDINCPNGQIFAGYDSNGLRQCYAIQNWMNFGDLIDQTSLSTCNAGTSNGVGFVISGTKVQVQCIPAAPVNCVGSWGPCVSSSQTYTIYTPASGGGSACPATNGQTQACVSCTPVNGAWGAWGAYGPCSAGYKWRYRSCNNPTPSCGGSSCVGSNSSNSTSGCGGCFVAGTQIAMADGSAKNIEDVLKGDQLQDAQSKTVTVQKLLRREYWGDIHSINGGPYFFTPNHPFMTVEGWKSLAPLATKEESPGLDVGQLKTGDILIKSNGLELILTIDSKITEEKIYNFELDASHSYMADEYKVHNKCAAPACSPGYHWYSCDPTNCSGTCNDNLMSDPICSGPTDPLL